MDTLRSCFTSAIEQRRALEAVGDFFQAVELNLYDASVCAFDPSSSGQEAFRCFMNIYNELSGPNWSVWRSRNPAPHWGPQQIFDTIKREFAEYPWDGTANLTSFGRAEAARLKPRLESMRGIKPNKGYPIMTVSKFLHFYNPALFPIYDTEVIWKKVCDGYFKSDFRDFCRDLCDREGPRYTVFMNEDTVDFLPAYMRWAASLFSVAHSGFMQVFVDWLGDQLGANLLRRKFDAKTLHARAFEYTAVGAAIAGGC
jgi:hypothetical protein